MDIIFYIAAGMLIGFASVAVISCMHGLNKEKKRQKAAEEQDSDSSLLR